eukprot:2790929-Amphidinium_carterae.1
MSVICSFDGTFEGSAGACSVEFSCLGILLRIARDLVWEFSTAGFGPSVPYDIGTQKHPKK